MFQYTRKLPTIGCAPTEGWLRRDGLLYAAALASGLRSADAIHLATAIRLQADGLATYDAELLVAAANAGLTTLTPGRA